MGTSDHNRHPSSHGRDHHHGHDHSHAPSGDHRDPRYRRILCFALAINAAMCAVEIVSGLSAQSVSLLADAIDFGGDALNYGLALAVIASGAIVRSRVALLKGVCMLAFGAFLVGKVYLNWRAGVVPTAMTMGVIGVIALIANLGVAAMLYAWREGDANMRSVWLCTRNDALSNIAVVAAAIGVFGTSSGWPDLAVALFMAVLALWSGAAVVKQSIGELASSGDSK